MYTFRPLSLIRFSSPSRPQTNVDKKKLLEKRRELKLLIKFYNNRITWLMSESRLLFGLVMGSSVAVVVESSLTLAQQQEGHVWKQCKDGLRLFIEQQLVTKRTVYFIKFGNTATPKQPQGLPFTKFGAEYVR